MERKGQAAATIFKLADIAVGLDFAPGAKGMNLHLVITGPNEYAKDHQAQTA